MAAGKSTVCQIFKDLGAYVISADDVVHQLLSPNTVIGQQVIRLLGTDILSDSQIDRKKIAERVFERADLLQAMEKIIHPAVFDEIEKKYQEVAVQGKYTFFIAEIPLLFESGAEDRFDAVVSVIADTPLCRKRFMKTTGKKYEEFDLRMARQLAPAQKAARATHVVTNNGSLADLKSQINNLFSTL